MAEIGNLTVKIGIEGANKAIQDLEKVRKQLELISTLARNTAASFATFNTQLRTFDGLARSMDNASRSNTRFNYGIQNTARIFKDFNSGNTRKGFADIIQTLAGVKVLRGGSPVLSNFSGAAQFGNLLQQAYLQKQSNMMKNPFFSNFANTTLGKKLFPGIASVSGPDNGGIYYPGMTGQDTINFLTRMYSRATNRKGPLSAFFTAMNTTFGAPDTTLGKIKGSLNATGSPFGLAAIGGAVGIFIGVIKLLEANFKFMANAAIQGGQALYGFARQAIQIGAEFQSLKSANISATIGAAGGFSQNQINAFTSNPSLMRSNPLYMKAMQKSGEEFKYMRYIAEKSIYTLPEIAGAANILKTAKIPLNSYLQTVALTGQATGLRGSELQLVSRLFTRLAFGDYPDPEVAARFGLTRTNPELKKMGLNFTKEGQLLTPSNQAVKIIKQYLDKTFGAGFLIGMMDFNVKFATLQDKFFTMMEKFAGPIMNALIPLFETLGKTFENLAKSGYMQVITSSIVTFIDDLNSKLKNGELDTSLALVMTVAQEIPRQLQILADGMVKIMNVFSKVGPADIIGFITDPLGVREAGVNLGRKIRGQKPITNPLRQLPSIIADVLSGQVSPYFSFAEEYQANLAMIRMSKNVKPGKYKPPKPEDFLGDNLTKATQETAKNTKQLLDVNKKMFDLFDMRRQTIGLGPLGQIGVTGAELAAMGMPFAQNRGVSIGPLTGYQLRHPGSISPGPVRGSTMIEKGLNSVNNKGFTHTKAPMPIRTNR